jgi:hypothetical protein
MSNSPVKILVRPFKQGDTSQFLELHEAVFGSWHRANARELFDWKYCRLNRGREVPVYLAFDRETLVGARGYMAAPAAPVESGAMAFQSVDLMVRKEYRNRGVFKKLNEFCEAVHAEGGPRILFSFPRERPRDAYRRAGWEIYANRELVAPRFSRSLFQSAGAACALQALGSKLRQFVSVSRNLSKLSGNRYRVELGELKEEDIKLASNLTNTVTVGYERTEHFLRWRLSEPGKSFKSVVLYSGTAPLAVLFFNCTNHTVYIRDIYGSGAADLPLQSELLLSWLIKAYGFQFNYQLWSNTNELFSRRLGFMPLSKVHPKFVRHEIAVRCHNLPDSMASRIRGRFVDGSSGISLIDFDC